MRTRGIILALALVALTAFFQYQTAAYAWDAPKEPTLQSLTVIDREGNSVELLDHAQSVHLGASYVFKAQFSEAELIDKVYITSTKNGTTKLLEAEWNGSVFATCGTFDKTRTDYIPGKIGIKYTKKVAAPKVGDEPDWTPMQEAWKDQTTATIQMESSRSLQASVDLSQLLQNEADVAVQVSVDVFDATTNSNLDEFLGMYKEIDKLTKYVLEDGDYDVYLDTSRPSAYAALVKDVSGSKWIKMILAADEADGLDAIAGKLGDINLLSTLASNYLKVSEAADEMRNELELRADITDEEREELSEKLDAYEKDRQMFDLTMVVIPAAVAASGGLATGPAIAFTALLGAIRAASDTFWDHRLGMSPGGEAKDTIFMSDAHGIPLTRSGMSKVDDTLTESGYYYLAENIGSFQVGEEDGTPIDVHLDLNGYWCGITCYGSAVTVYDCEYRQTIAGNGSVKATEGSTITVDRAAVNWIEMTGGGSLQIEDGAVSRIKNEAAELEIRKSVIGRITNASGDISISGSQVGGLKTWAVDSESGSVVISDSVIGSHGIHNGETGTVEISGSKLVDGSITNRGKMTLMKCEISGEIANDRGKLELTDTNVVGCITNEGAKVSGVSVGGELEISGGVFRATDGYNIINRWGTLTVEGGTFIVETVANGMGSYYGANIFAQTSNSNSFQTTTIRGGSFSCKGEDGYCVECYKSGSSMSGVENQLTIHGGSFYSEGGDCLRNNGGTMTVNGGVFRQKSPSDDLYVCVRNSGTLTINGGSFYKSGGFSCVESSGNGLTITGGRFSTPQLWHCIEGNCVFLLNADSEIEIEAVWYGNAMEAYGYKDPLTVTVKAEDGYTGGLTYFAAWDAAGIDMSISAANEIDFTAPYIRLVGNSAVKEPLPQARLTDGTLQIRHAATVSEDLLAAFYDETGRMRGVFQVKGETAANGVVSITVPSGWSEAGTWKVFRLGSGFIPVSAVLSGDAF